MNIIELIENSGDDDISLDLRDINILLKHHGYAYIDEKRGQIDNIFEEMFGNNKIQNPKGIILYYKINENFEEVKIDEMIELYLDDFISNEYIDIIECKYIDNSLDDEEIILGCIVTGMQK